MGIKEENSKIGGSSNDQFVVAIESENPSPNQSQNQSPKNSNQNQTTNISYENAILTSISVVSTICHDANWDNGFSIFLGKY